MKEKLSKLKSKFKIKHKKRFIIICIIIFFILFKIISNILNPKTDDKAESEIEDIQKRNIATSISATGKIVSNDTKTVTTTLTGMKIKTVNVKDGDKVSVGDVICTFDTADISDNLAKAQKSLSVTKEQSNLSIQGAQRSLNDAIANRDTQVSSGNSDVQSALKAYKDVENELTTAKSNLDKKKSEKATYENSYNTSKTEYEKIEKEYNSKKSAYDLAKANYENALNTVNSTPQQVDSNTITDNKVQDSSVKSEEIDKLKAEMEKAKAEFDSYQAIFASETQKFTQVKTAYDAISAEVSAMETTVNTLQSNVDNLYHTYDKTVTAYNSTVNNANSAIASMQDSLKNSQLAASVSTQAQETQIRTYKEQLADGILTSTVDGVVTSINVKEGDIYTGTAIAVIKGCEDFVIESEIDEYDIADVKVGMKVLIKTDATRKEELQGTVTYVAPSATESMVAGATGATNNYATYTVKISLDTPNERLRLGMNAKLSIVTNEKESVWTVPYSAVRERENGDKYLIIKRNNSEDEEELDIETGLEGSYYIEIISEKLEDGMKVVLPPIESENSVEALIEMMGADGGL